MIERYHKVLPFTLAAISPDLFDRRTASPDSAPQTIDPCKRVISPVTMRGDCTLIVPEPWASRTSDHDLRDIL